MSVTSILSGYTRECGRQSGGVSIIGIIPAGDITEVSVAEGKITAILMASGKCFKKYDTELDNAEYKFTTSEVSLQLRFNRNGTASSKAYNELLEAAGCGLVAIAKLNNGETVLIGYTEEFGFSRPITSMEADASSGKTITDPNYFNVTLKSSQVVAPLYLDKEVDFDALFTTEAA